jgi:hypothetical protein
VLATVDAEILAYYEYGLERDRLASGRQRIEFLRVWDLLEMRPLVAASGSVKLFPGLSQLLDIPEARDHVLSVLRLLETEPSLLGMSQNFVAIAQAPAAK